MRERWPDPRQLEQHHVSHSAIVAASLWCATVIAIPVRAQGRLYALGSPFVMGQREQPDSVPILRWDPRTQRTDTPA